MPTAKHKIKIVVQEYKKLFPIEYSIVCDMVKQKRELTMNEFNHIEGTDTEMRGLFEIDEVLNNLIVRALDSEELNWFKMGTQTSRNQGGRWFAKTFPQFALAKKI